MDERAEQLLHTLKGVIDEEFSKAKMYLFNCPHCDEELKQLWYPDKELSFKCKSCGGAISFKEGEFNGK